MNKIMTWMSNVFAPKANKIAHNVWIASIQESILTTMPFILVGSIITIINIFRDYLNWIPNLQLISDFSFGLMSLYLAYLIPATILEKKHKLNISRQSGLVGIALFLMIANPLIDEASNITYHLAYLGTGGMIASLISGLFVGFIMNLSSKFTFFDEDSSMPDFIKVWFDTILPVFLILVLGWIFTFYLKINVFDIIYEIFTPFLNIGQSFWGFVLLNFLCFSFIYSFGISSWVLFPILFSIRMQGYDANMAAIAAGEAPHMIHVTEVVFLTLIGGGGSTLALNIMMLFAKSKKLKVIGKATIVPSIANINEPLVFGAPIAFNPMLMIPMWIMGLLGPTIVYLAVAAGLVPIPTTTFTIGYFPFPITGWIIAGLSGVIIMCLLFVISWIVYYPFFKVYDNQVYEEETRIEGEE